MPKILLFSDCHIHTHKTSLKRLQHCLEALEWVFKTAVERNIKTVVFLGDLFQDREKIQVLPYQRTYEILNKYAGGKDPKVKLYLLVGNHDMWFADRTDVSSVYPLGAITNVEIISDCRTVNIEGINVDFLPFTLNPLKSIERLLGSGSKLLCGHIALHGAKLNTFYDTQADVSVEYEGDMTKVESERFARWQKVFLGHYHGEQRIDQIEYVGSPLQLNFAEAFQEKHIIELDLDTLEQSYIVNHFSPKHYILRESEINDIDLTNAFVKVQPENLITTDLFDLKNELVENRGILSLEFTAPKSQEDNETRAKIQDIQKIMTTNKEEMIVEYVKATGVPKGMDFDELIEIGKLIIQKSNIA